jgi:hypothetical protein
VRKRREDAFIRAHGATSLNKVNDALRRGYFRKNVPSKHKRSRRVKATQTIQVEDIVDQITNSPLARDWTSSSLAKEVWGAKRVKGKPKYTKNSKTLRDNRGQIESTHAGKQKTPTTLHGFDRKETEANIARFEEGEDGKIMVDPWNVSNRWWVKETSIINNLIRPTDVLNGDWGDESDLLTLRANFSVSSAVAGKMSQLILQDYPQ